MARFTNEVSVLVKLTFETDTQPTDDQLVAAGLELQECVEHGRLDDIVTRTRLVVPGTSKELVSVHFDDHDINVDEYATIEEEKT